MSFKCYLRSLDGVRFISKPSLQKGRPRGIDKSSFESQVRCTSVFVLENFIEELKVIHSLQIQTQYLLESYQMLSYLSMGWSYFVYLA